MCVRAQIIITGGSLTDCRAALDLAKTKRRTYYGCMQLADILIFQRIFIQLLGAIQQDVVSLSLQRVSSANHYTYTCLASVFA